MNISYVMCTDCENNKIRLTSPSSFVNVLYLACATMNRNLTVHNTLLTHGVLTMVSNVCREVDKVREERLRQRECDRLRRETNKERQVRLVSL